MNVSLVKVSRYSYSDSDGVYHDGCNFCILEPIETNDSNIGYDFKRFSCKYELYEKLVSIFKEGKPVKLDIEYVPMKNGNYYAKCKRINDIEL